MSDIEIPMGGDSDDVSAENRDRARQVTVAAARSLEAAVTALSGDIVQLHDYSKKNRRLIRLLTISVVFDILLSIGLGTVAYQARQAGRDARVAQRITCLANNQARAAQIQLWTYLLALPSTTGTPSQAQQQQVVEFRAYLNAVFAQRDCADVNSFSTKPLPLPPGVGSTTTTTTTTPATPLG